MHTRPAETVADASLAREARDLIRSCVHCGFCLPACPTYRVTGNELDSPRGRIYLIREMLERGAASIATRTHLDRCLSCRACEPACPSGVQYGRLVDLGRELLELRPPASPRPRRERWLRAALGAVATRRALFTPIVRAGQALRRVLPSHVAALLPPRPRCADRAAAARPARRDGRRVTLLTGCVQPALAPQVDAAASRVLQRLGFRLVPSGAIGCCGALDHHLGRVATARRRIARNVEAGVRLLDQGVESLVSTASGCGTFTKDHAHALRHEPAELRAAATRVGAATRDLCEVIDVEALAARVLPRQAADAGSGAGRAALRVAWQAPCSLQHGQRQATAGKVEALLRAIGCELVAVGEPTLCCGSAGTYSLLQPEMSRELRRRKLESLLRAAPDVVATANVGCLEHLRQASPVPVKHWIEIVDALLA